MSELCFPFSQMFVFQTIFLSFPFPLLLHPFLYSDYGHLVCKALLLLITLCCGEMKRL